MESEEFHQDCINEISDEQIEIDYQDNDGLRQYLDFQESGGDTPTSLKESAMRYLGGSSEGIIDKVTIEAKTPSAFQVEMQVQDRGQDDIPYFSEIVQNNESLNQFKRRKNKSSVENPRCSFVQPQPQNILSHSKKQSHLIDLTNQILIDSNRQHTSNKKLQILDEQTSLKHPAIYKSQTGLDDDKENYDPHGSYSLQRFKRNKSTTLLDFNQNQLRHFHSQSSRVQNSHKDDFASRFLDNQLTDFDQRVQKLKQQNGNHQQHSRTVDDINSALQQQFNDKQRDEDSLQYQTQELQPEIIEAKVSSFKRNNSKTSSIGDGCKVHDSSAQILELKRENHSLKQEIEKLKSNQHQDIASMRHDLFEKHGQELLEREEENQIILDGMRTDYEERIEVLRIQLCEQQQRHDLQIREQQMIFECRLAEYRRQIEELDREIDGMRRHQEIANAIPPELIKVGQSRQNNRGPQQSQSLRSLQVQRNLFQFEDVVEEDQPLSQFQGLQSYSSVYKIRSSLLPQNFGNPKIEQMPQQPLKQASSYNYSSNSLSSKPPLHQQSIYSNGLTMSKSKEQAMNFSFSDINRTESAKKNDIEILDQNSKQQNIMPLRENLCSNFIQKDLESPQVELAVFKQSEKSSPMKRRTPTLKQILEGPSSIGMDPSLDFMSPELHYKKGSQTTTNRKSRFFEEALKQHSDLNLEDDGCENAPDESGFVSDEMEYHPQQRIINESSLEEQHMNFEDEDDQDYQSEYRDNCDPELYSPSKDRPQGNKYTQRQLFMMTGKSESVIDEDDEDVVPAITKSKAIHSSCINLKRNQMIPQIGVTMTSRTWI